MADHPLHNPKDYSETLRQILTTDPVHADTLNPLFERLLNNDAFIKAAIDALLSNANGHNHTGVDGEGPKINHADLLNKGTNTHAQIDAHIGDASIHVTAADKSLWNETAANYNQYASGKDANGIYTVLELKRTDGTLYMRATLTNPDARGNYQTDTWQFYNAAGNTVVKTLTWTYTYDADGKITSKVVA